MSTYESNLYSYKCSDSKKRQEHARLEPDGI